MLRLIAVTAIGTGAVIGAGALLRPEPRNQASESKAAKYPTGTAALAATPGGSSIPSQPTTVKVTYFQMPTIVPEGAEHYVLPTPAHYSDLLGVVLMQHPGLAPMMPSMMVLVEGVAPQPGTILRDGDEVDFIPAMAGG